MIRSLLREPLVHFVALGLLLFLYSGWRGAGPAGRHITVTRGQLEHLVARFARTWHRQPTEEEVKTLVDEHVREELASREAMIAGLHRDDPVIRRRLRQRLELMTEDLADQAPPTDAELRAWVDAHPGTNRSEPLVALRQVFVNRELRGTQASAEAERLLRRLRGANPEPAIDALGDRSLLPAEMPLVPVREVSSTFGDAFAKAIESAPIGRWTGPVESGYGLHLVLIREREAAAQPGLDELRALAEREVVEEHRRIAIKELYAGLLGNYVVEVEWSARDAGAIP